MKISTKSRYGTRMMVDLALHSDKSPVVIKDIAGRQDVSEKYLEQIIAILKNAGLVKSIRGAYGGYTLSKPAAEIVLGDIVKAIEGELSIVECVNSTKVCERVSSCVTREVWAQVQKKIADVFSSITLKDMVDNHRNKEQSLNYII